MSEAPTARRRIGGTCHSLSEVKPSLKPEELLDDGIPEEMVFISFHIEEKHLNSWRTECFDRLPNRDSFSSCTEYDRADPKGRPNGLTHETYMELLQEMVQVLEKRPWILKRSVRQHRGEWAIIPQPVCERLKRCRLWRRWKIAS